MDQVRAILKVIYQQRFWVLSVIVVIVAAVCWKMAAGRLDAEFVAHKGTIDNHFKDMKGISGAPFHGNEAVNRQELLEAVKIRKQAYQLWEKLYNRQRENVLKWPESLGEEFLTYVEKLTFSQPIADVEMRQIYREYAKERFPQLVEIVDARKAAAGEMAGAMMGGRGDSMPSRGMDAGGMLVEQVDENGNPIPQEKYLVEWLDQGLLEAQLNFPQRPTSMQIWVTQEDLWVYETMLHVIADANEANGATRPDNAAIRTIMALEVGQRAALASKVPGAVMLPPSAAPAGGDGATDTRSAMGFGDGGMAAAGVDPDAALLVERYLGPEGEPLADGATATEGEFRMLPVRMQLVMQQTAIPSVLIECANATLPIEVKRIRINPERSGAGFDAALAGAAAPTGGGGSDGGTSRYAGTRGDGGGGRSMGDGGGMAATPLPGVGSTGYATVELHGIVYIYNPPNATTLTVPGEETLEPQDTVAAADSGTVGG
ncbi:MAG TPA: hypothetical protein VEQ85_06895 [Lacipirellulaceae bacterium]|nr:hypothetical protein [Lacipirellulaceae bacterium]